jgi:hypothetical protein
MKTKPMIFVALLMSLMMLGGAAQAADIALTPVGQSPDAMMVKVLLKKMKLKADLNKLLKGSDLKGHKILIAVAGGSAKGLGAAGIDKDQEIKRANELFAAAKAKGMKTLVMQLGGARRRGKLSDAFISCAVPHGDAVIYVKGANKDGLIDKLLKDKKVPVHSAGKIRATMKPLKEVLTAWGLIK